MVDWGKGYVTDIEYTEHFYAAQAPHVLALTALFNACESPDLDAGFAYCELGCGRGLTSLLLAAVNPKGIFHAVDFNPASIARADARARAAGLDNITFHERSFETLSEPSAGLPMFDVVTMHGVWSWISPELQRAITAFLKSHLKPGGLVYISYNSLPAWNDVIPLQRLLRDLALAQPGRSDQAAGNAIAMLNRLAEKKVIPPRFQDALKRLNLAVHGNDLTYLVHEYLHAGWSPYYFTDVASALAEAKLSYVGSTNLPMNFWNIGLSEEQRVLLSGIEPAELRETLKEFCTNSWFRQDVFVRGPRGMTDARRQPLLNDLFFAQIGPVPEVIEIAGPGGVTFRPDPVTYRRIFAALESGPRRVGELRSLPGLPSTVGALDLVATLVSSGIVSLW